MRLNGNILKKLLSLAQVGLVPENSAQPKMAMVALDKLKNRNATYRGKANKKSVYEKIRDYSHNFISYCGMYDVLTIPLIKKVMFSVWWGIHGLAQWLEHGYHMVQEKFQLEFEDMSLIEKDMLEPIIRLIYIGICSLIFELFFIMWICNDNSRKYYNRKYKKLSGNSNFSWHYLWVGRKQNGNWHLQKG
mgnify:CR=1 FL=1